MFSMFAVCVCVLDSGFKPSTRALKKCTFGYFWAILHVFSTQKKAPESLIFQETLTPEALRKTLAEGWKSPSASGVLRIGEAPSEEVLRLFRESDEVYSNKSQSRHELQETLKDFNLMEGPVYFPPTYRLMEGKNIEQIYDMERQPAWCDRILHSKVSVKRKSYCALGLTQSDHRPISALLETVFLKREVVAKGAKEVKETTVATSVVNSPAESPVAEPPDLLDMTVPLQETKGDLVGYEAESSPGKSPTSFASSPTEAPGEPLLGDLQVGQLVYAKYQDGWFFANVTRNYGALVDVAWLRPQGDIWGDQRAMSRYLCSTNADETLHGDRLAKATHIRLPEASPASAPSATSAPSGFPSFFGEIGEIDLLG